MTSALAEPPWSVCSACLGTPAVFTLGVMQLVALLGFPCWLTQVGCSTPAVMVSQGLGVVLSQLYCSPLFSFLCLCSFPFPCFPFGVLPPYRVGWHVCLQFASLLFGVAGGGLLRLFSSVPVRCFPCCRYIGFSELLLLCLLAGVVVALHPVSGCSSCGVVCLVCRWGSPAAFSLP